MPLAIDLHEHLVKVSAPMTKTPHAVYTTQADLSREHRPEPVPPKAHRFVSNVDAAFGQYILDVPQRQQLPDIQHR